MNIFLCRSIPLRKKQAQEEYLRWSSLSEEEKTQYDEPIQPLRLIIMSATMRISDFQNPLLFPQLPPVIRVRIFYSIPFLFLSLY